MGCESQSTMKFELEESNRGISDDELLDDMRRCAKVIGRGTITMAEYRGIGKAAVRTIVRRFDSWTKALRLAGLEPSRYRKDVTEEELFENIKSLWIGFGRQPRYSEVKRPISHFSAKPYEDRFGSFTKALKAFVAWVNSDSPEQDPQEPEAEREADSTIQRASTKHRTRREISERQRFRILMRDGFCCRSCGATPLTKPGVELHVDHILPWSKGGETTDDNLETKCKQCNLGKGNAFNA